MREEVCVRARECVKAKQSVAVAEAVQLQLEWTSVDQWLVDWQQVTLFSIRVLSSYLSIWSSYCIRHYHSPSVAFEARGDIHTVLSVTL